MKSSPSKHHSSSSMHTDGLNKHPGIEEANWINSRKIGEKTKNRKKWQTESKKERKIEFNGGRNKKKGNRKAGKY